MASKQQRQLAQEKDRKRRMAWWFKAKYGMFVHWGLYSHLARGEWTMEREAIPAAEYELLAKQFRPKPNPAREWVALAKKAGMKYVVLTAKHHEGYCLWDTATTDYCAPKQAAGRDLVAEYVETVRAAGLGVGIYFSLMDWHHPDGMKGLIDPAARKRFLDYTHSQVRELCSNYGKIDILWYDMPMPYKTWQGWESKKLNAMVRKLQPGIIINDRSHLPEDYSTPEQQIIAQDRAWECCMTINNNWGYVRNDESWKSPKLIVRNLALCARDGGNYMLNVGPLPDGTVPRKSADILCEVGDWLKRNGEAIFDTERNDVRHSEFAVFTRRGKTLYACCHSWPGSDWSIGGLKTKVKSVQILATGQKLKFVQTPLRLHVTGCPEQAPDGPVSVIKLECASVPHQRPVQEVRRLRQRAKVNVSFRDNKR
ncbi:MAG: alpha-L-fucosidase [Phycisphaerae bacterium]|jgi:alpha-L-fucosidase